MRFCKGLLSDYFKKLELGYQDIVIVSSEKNTNMDLLLKKVERLKKSKNVYVIGYTNAGKSSLINKLIKNYSDKTQGLTMSPLPSTTLNTLTIEINDYLTIIDTPGLIDPGSILNQVSGDLIKKIGGYFVYFILNFMRQMGTEIKCFTLKFMII